MTDDAKPFDPLPALRFMSKTENWELALMASSAVELIESLTARLASAEAERDALADTCVEAADQISTLRGLLREAVDAPVCEEWFERVTAALEGKP